MRVYFVISTTEFDTNQAISVVGYAPDRIRRIGEPVMPQSPKSVDSNYFRFPIITSPSSVVVNQELTRFIFERRTKLKKCRNAYKYFDIVADDKDDGLFFSRDLIRVMRESGVQVQIDIE